MELIAQKLPYHIAEETWQDCGRILRHAKPSSPNLSQDDFWAIKRLNDNPHVLDLKVDKGNVLLS